MKITTAAHEIFIFIPLDENKSFFYGNDFNILYILITVLHS
jgi:hypothetical protein